MKTEKLICLATCGLHLLAAAGADPSGCALLFAGLCLAAAAIT